MAGTKDIRLFLYLDGIEFPIRSFSRVNMPGPPTFATISIPPHQRALRDIEPRTMVHVFYQISGDEHKRLLFEGELSGRPYHKDPSGMNISLSAVSYLGLLNHVPLAYLEYLTPVVMTILNHSNQFYGLDVQGKGARAYALERYIWAQLDEPTKRIILTQRIEENGIWEFFHKYLKMVFDRIEGDDKPLNEFMYYAERRLKISKDIMVLQDDQVRTQYKAETIAKIIQDLSGTSTDPNTMTTLNVVLNNMAQYQYRMFSIPSPSYISREKIAKVKKLIPYWEKGVSRRSEAYAPGYVILPDIFFALPPQCNVLKSRKQDSLSMNISDYKITRLLNEYAADFVFQGDDISKAMPFYSAAYPEQVEKLRIRHSVELKDNSGIPMTEYEQKYGMVPTHQRKDWLYNKFFAEYRGRDNTEEQMAALNRFARSDVRYDFYKKRYTDTLEFVTPRFLPEVTAGFPGMIYDDSIDMKYYGMISRVTLSIDQDSATGGINTGIQMTNVLSAEKGESINQDTIMLYDEDQREGLSEFLPMNPFVDQDLVGPANIGAFYEAVLGCGAHNYNTWYDREYPQRQVITFREYLRNKEITQVIDLDAIGQQIEVAMTRQEEGKKRPDLPDLARLTPGNHYKDDDAPSWLKNYIDTVDRKGLIQLIRLRELYESKRI